jgi:ribosomal protein S18 acetylase RimI-like enzyme
MRAATAPPAAISLRRATVADAARLAVLAERTFRDTFTGQNSPQDMETHCAEKYGTEIQRSELADPQRVTLLAEAGETAAGFAQLVLGSAARCLNCARPAELNRLYVLGEWHGRGVAQELMAAVLSAAGQAKCDHVWLGVWERNPKAIAFYGKFGFEVIGEHRFVLGRDPQRDLVMALRIEPPPPAA